MCQLFIVPSLGLLLTDLLKPFTPVLDSLPSEFDAVSRLIILIVGIIGAFVTKNKKAHVYDVITLLLMTLGLFVLLQTGMTYVLDIALVLLVIRSSDFMLPDVSFLSILSCVLAATVICARKGYIRDYSFYGRDALGFRTLVYLYIVVAVIVVALAIMIFIYIKQRDIKRTVLLLIYCFAVSGVITLIALKALNLSAAVEAGSYELYAEESGFGVEAKMVGFEDFRLELGDLAPTSFEITPEGDYYLITMDSYGVTRTLCVLEGQLMLGNYEQSEPAHLWDINAVTGTPYFTLSNVETGLQIVTTDEGQVKVADPGEGNAYLRIGSENIDYYDDLIEASDNDFREATVSCDPTVSYEGVPVSPSTVTVELNGVTLVEDVDYKVSCWNNLLPGTAYIEIKGIGDYQGVCGTDFRVIYDDEMCDDPFYTEVADYMVRAYRLICQRLPDMSEMRAWMQSIAGGIRTPDTVVIDFYISDSFTGSNASNIEALYRTLLLRNGSRGELREWIDALNAGADLGEVIHEISITPEYQNIWHNFGMGFR
ncbi:MAG: hypothetical protein IJ757_01785 [Clostridiales bacterium]|nr:hypothetical protein [Clostridiales bacterium]